MLKVRVIPTLLWKNVGLVKGVGFDSWRRVGTAMPAVKVYNARDVDELAFLDITASLENREPDFEAISELALECFVPFAVGGGVCSVEIVRRLLLSGADKVVINSPAYRSPELITEVAMRFGSQCVVAGIDVRQHSDGTYECFSHSGNMDTGRNPMEWAQELEKLGAGELLVTRIEYDGAMNGYDVQLIREITKAVTIPVIASGGAGNYEHIRQVIQDGGASAAAAASIFHFTEQTPLEAKKALAKAGIPVRLNLN